MVGLGKLFILGFNLSFICVFNLSQICDQPCRWFLNLWFICVFFVIFLWFIWLGLGSNLCFFCDLFVFCLSVFSRGACGVSSRSARRSCVQLRCSLCEAPQKVRGGTDFWQIWDRFLTDFWQIWDRFLTDYSQIFHRLFTDAKPYQPAGDRFLTHVEDKLKTNLWQN